MYFLYLLLECIKKNIIIISIDVGIFYKIPIFQEN